MQLPPIERIPNLRPAGNEGGAVAARVIPVAPVNPMTNVAIAPVDPTPSVINMVNQANKPSTGEAVYTSVSDPARPGSEAATSEKDWTIHRPAPEKVEDPPPVPISKVLMEHIKSLWIASASAVQVQQQVKNQLDTSQPNLNATPGVLSSEVFTYSPSKINKTEQI